GRWRASGVGVEGVRSGLNPASSIILAQPWGAGPSRWVFPEERGSPAALPRQPPFASELLQMVLASYASWQHRKESTDALHCKRCIGFCICGVCPRRKQRPQSGGGRRGRRNGAEGGRGGRPAESQGGKQLGCRRVSPRWRRGGDRTKGGFSKEDL